MSAPTTSAEFFDAKYRADPDPWSFASDPAEMARYDTIIAALGERQYQDAYEPGCSVGELTCRLAQRCARVTALDISATAVKAAQERCAGLSNVSVRVGAMPHQMPEGMFDLIVFSEIGYYFQEADLLALGTMLVSRLQTSGTLLAVHWLGTSKDHLLGGDRVHEILRNLGGLQLERAERHPEFRLDRWRRV